MKRAWILVLALFAGGACSRGVVSIKDLLWTEQVEVFYLMNDATWAPADSISWHDRTSYRQLRFDTDRDGKWNYLYAEVYDDVGGWVWIPSTTRINPEEEPELAKTKSNLVRKQDAPSPHSGVDDFGYGRR